MNKKGYIGCNLLLLIVFSCSTLYAQKQLPLKKLFDEPIYVLEKDHDDPPYDWNSTCNAKFNCLTPLINQNKKEILRLKVSCFDFRDTIPLHILEYPNLREVFITTVILGELPDELLQLSHLEVLGVDRVDYDNYHDNFFQFQFSDEFLKLKSLKILRVFDSKVKYIPERIKELENIEVLDLRLNYEIEYLPLSIAQLKKLRVLKINNASKYESELKYIKQFLPKLKVIESGPYENELYEECYDWKVYKKDLKTGQKHKDKLQKGVYTDYYHIKQLRVKGAYKNSIPEGKWTFYYENGNIKQERYYKNGVEDGIWLFLDTLGNTKLRMEFQPDSNLTSYTYYKENNRIKYQNHYKNGLLEGDCILEESTDGQRIITYKNGLVDFYKHFYEGKISYTIDYQNGLRHGKFIFYNKQGRITREALYKKGKLEGKETTWYQDGTKRDESFFVNGNRIHCKFFGRDGNLQREINCLDSNFCWVYVNYSYPKGIRTIDVFGMKKNYEDIYWLDNGNKQVTNYKNGIKEGKSITYNKQGEIIKEEFYKDGKLVKTE